MLPFKSVRFNLCLVDPPHFRFGHFLFDALRLVALSLETLGHSCTLTRNRLERRAINLIAGGHLATDTTLLDELADLGQPYVVLQTEVIHERTVNREKDQSARFEQVFLPLLQRATAVWESAETNLAPLRQLGIDAAFLRYGYHPGLEEIRFKAERDLDFLFFGSLTPRRQAVLQRLTELGYRVASCFDDAALFRNDLIARSELLLTIRQSDAMAHLPQGRILYAVTNRALVAGESGLEQDALADVFLWTQQPDVVEFLRQCRARPDRRALADSFHDRLAQRPMAQSLAPVVEATCARL